LKITHNARGAWASLLTGIALAAFSAGALAQVSLPTVVDLAQRNSSAVKLADADVQKTQAALAQTRDVYIPSISIGSTVGYSVGFPTGQPSVGNAAMQSLVFSASQQQYIRAARAGLQAASLSLKEAREQVALDASTAYIELDAVNRELEAAHQQDSFTSRLVAIEQQRTEAGVDAHSDLLEAQLTAAQLKLKRLQLETRAATLSRQLAVLTGLPVGSISPDHGSIPEIPAVRADQPVQSTAGIGAVSLLARSKQFQAHGDQLAVHHLQVSFGAQYNYDSNELNNYTTYYKNFTPNNFSFGLQILLPIFDSSQHDKAQQSAAEALRARVEAEQAQQQNDIEIATLTGSLRELDGQADVTSLKQQIAGDKLQTVLAQLELGNGSGSGANAQPQLSPKAEQLARIDEREKYQDAVEADFDLAKARLSLLRALGHMEDWLQELHAK
jgi:outer membrane protein TolC